jgi:hypothetical protein
MKIRIMKEVGLASTWYTAQWFNEETGYWDHVPDSATKALPSDTEEGIVEMLKNKCSLFIPKRLVTEVEV